MIELPNELMSRHTTFRIGGPVEMMLQPESEGELIDAVRSCLTSGRKYRVLGNGSNLLVSDTGLQGVVINNQCSCTRLELQDGVVYAGSSVKLQAFIRFCVRNSLEGFEYLFSVPATIGGAIFMNAGRGKSSNRQISDHVLKVRAFDGNDIFELSRDDCKFEYRRSVFHDNRNWLILGAYFVPPPQEPAVGDAKIKERLRYVKQVQDYNKPSAGSAFKVGRHRIFHLVKGLRFGGAQYSKKTTNWISNLGNAKARDVILLIWVVKLLNVLTLTKAEPEIEYWK